MSKVIEFTDENFDIQLKNTDKPVLVDFYAPWCGHCRTQAPIIEKLAEEFSNKAVIAALNVDENNQKASQYFISGIPTILVFKNSKLVEQKAGVHSIDDLKNLIDKHV